MSGAQRPLRTLATANRLGRFALQTFEFVAGFLFHVRQGDRLEANLLTENIHFALAHFAPAAHGQIRGDEYRAETHALQAADHQPLGLPQTAHFAVTAFHHHAVIPVVEALTARCHLDIGELGRTVFEHHAGFQALDHFLVDFAAHAHRVFAVHLEGWMHQAVGQLTVGGEHQQTGGVDVETADVDPTALFRPRQAVEHGRTSFGVVAGADLAFGLVIDDHAAHAFGGFFALDQAAIDGDGIVQVDTLTEAGNRTIDLDPAGADPAFDFAA